MVGRPGIYLCRQSELLGFLLFLFTILGGGRGQKWAFIMGRC